MKAGLIATGGILIVIGIIVYVYPISEIGSVSDINDLCGTFLGQLGSSFNQDARQGCQIAKYIVVGSYALIGIGALLVIVGSIIQTGTVSPESKRTIGIGIAIAAAIAIGVVGYQLSLQPDIQVSELNVSRDKNTEFVKVLDYGRVSNHFSYDYTAPKDGTYYIILENDFSVFSSKYAFGSYSDNGKSYLSSLEIPPGTYKSIPVYAYAGQSINGDYSVNGGSGNDVDFSITQERCSQKVFFSFSLANYGPVSGNAQVKLNADGNSVWNNQYYVETQKQISKKESITIPDCNDHVYNMYVESQQRVG